MNKLLNKKLLTSAIFAFSAIICEIFLFVYLKIGVFPTYFLLDLSIILFISFAIFFIRDGWPQNTVLFFFLSCQIILSYMNTCISNALADVFSFEMLSLVTETADVITFDIFPIWPLIFYLVILGADIVAVCFLNKIKPTKRLRQSFNSILIKNVALWGATISMCLYSVGALTIVGDKDDALYLLSDKVLFDTFSSNKQSLSKFGTYGYYFEEFFRQFDKQKEVVTYSRAELEAFVGNEEYNAEDSPLWNVCKDQNVIMIMAESFEWYAISPEVTPTLYALANGYDFGTASNDYANFNFYNFDVDEDGEPDVDENGFLLFGRSDYEYDSVNKSYSKKETALSTSENKIYENLFDDENLFSKYGLKLSSFYSKSKTDYAEASAILGNYPYNESFTTHGGILGFSSTDIYKNVDYNFSLPNLLSESKSVDKSQYIHSYLSTFYGRDTLMGQFGFDSSLFLDQMSSTITRGDRIAHAALDSQVLDFYLNITDKPIISSDSTTFTYMTTITTHGEFSENPLLTKYYEFMDSSDVNYFGKTGMTNTELVAAARNYLTSALDTEYMMTILVKYLMDNDLFDKTTIVFFADHQSYYSGLDLDFKSVYYDQQNTTIENYNYTKLCSDRFNVPAFIYSTAINDDVVGTTGHNVTKLTNAFDFLPTVLTLKGVNFVPSYYFGYPVICPNGGAELGQFCIVSPTGGIFDKSIFSEDGQIFLHNKYGALSDEAKLYFTTEVARTLDKRYKVTALYKYSMFR